MFLIRESWNLTVSRYIKAGKGMYLCTLDYKDNYKSDEKLLCANSATPNNSMNVRAKQLLSSRVDFLS